MRIQAVRLGTFFLALACIPQNMLGMFSGGHYSHKTYFIPKIDAHNEGSTAIRPDGFAGWKEPLSSIPLFSAVEENDLEECKKALENGASAKACNPHSGLTPLHIACANGYSKIVELLLKEQAYTEAQTNKYDYTPLHLACISGHLETVKLLVQYGAHVKAKSNNKSTALHLANKYPTLTKFLLENGCKEDVNAQDDSGKTPLQGASPEVAELLKQYGAK